MTERKALYAGTCRTCGEAFPAGTRILWSREEGARHVPQECGQHPELGAEDGGPVRFAVYAGRCKNCQEPIDVGDPIRYERGVGAFHSDCEMTVAPNPERAYGGGDVTGEPVEAVVPNGHYTVMLGRPDQKVYVRLNDGFKDGQQKVSVDFPEKVRDAMGAAIRWPGRWVAFGTVEGQDLFVWRRFEGLVPDEALQAVRALLAGDRWTEFGEAFAEEFQVCYRCESDLSAPASLCRGVGPVCAEALGIVVDKEAVEAWMREHPVEAVTN